MKKIVTNKDIRSLSYKMIRSYIASNAVPAGAKINEDELAQKLGISKTPVRDALSKLSLEGYVKIVPNRGAFKTKLSAEDVQEIMAIREVLEGLAIRIAGPNLTTKTIGKLREILSKIDKEHASGRYTEYQDLHDDFYSIIYSTAKSPRLVRLIWSMYQQIKGVLGSHYFSTPERIGISINGKHKILDALEKGDVDAAESVRRKLVNSTRDILIKEIDRQDQKSRMSSRIKRG